MLASPGTVASLTAAATWRLEGKWDGMRAVAHLDAGRFELRSRTGRDVAAGCPELAELPRLLKGQQVVLDGEIAAMDATGRTDFGRLQRRIGLTNPADVERIRRRIPLAYLIFDVLELDGTPQHHAPLDGSRQLLDSLHICRHVLPRRTAAHRRPRDGAAPEQNRPMGRSDRQARRLPLPPGARTRAWIKLKNSILAALIGWQPGQGPRADTIGSPLLANLNPSTPSSTRTPVRQLVAIRSDCQRP